MYATVQSAVPGLVRSCSSVAMVVAAAIWLDEPASAATFASPKSRILA
jgi:hypothetical protein